MPSRPSGPGKGDRVAVAEVVRLVAPARAWLAGAVAVGLGQAMLLVVQAGILAGLLADAFDGALTGRAAAVDCVRVAAVAAGQGLSGWAWEACTEAAARRVRAAARRRALTAAIGSVPQARSRTGEQGEPWGPGGMATLLSSGVDELDPFVARFLPRAVLVLAVPVLLLAWIGHLDLASAGLAGAAVVIASLLAGLVGADTAVAVRRRLASVQRLGDRFDALVAGLPLLRAFGRARDHERAVAASGEDVRAATLATLRIALLAGLVLELLAAVGTALVAVRLGLRLDAGQRILPQALAVLMLTPEVFLPLRRLTADFHAGAGGRAVLARLADVTAGDRRPCTLRGVVPAPAASSAAVPVALRQHDGGPVGVVLEAVCLSAEGRRHPVLDRVDLQVFPRERVCLVGDSGAGKSSLLRVIAGLVPASSGRVRLEGPAAGRPRALGWVPQCPTVLPATVLDNVSLGRPGIDERATQAALEAAGLGRWLRSLPLGLHTPLSGIDAPLSLGERRRLAVARSVAGPRPGLWLLDEPTAGLDRHGARQLVMELRRIVAGATAVIATHDPLAMTLGHRTMELSHGRIRGDNREPASPARPHAPAVSAR